MKKIIKTFFILLLILVILAVIAVVITGGKIMFKALDTQGEFTHLIVLGTAVDGTEPSPMLNDRIQAAGKFLEANPDVICVVTGGKTEGGSISEAQCMFNELVELGIDPSRILKEEQATSTIENFKFSLELLEKKLGKLPENVGVLSSEFHLLRSSMIAEDLGVHAVVIPATTSSIKDFATFFLREIFMVWYDWARLLFIR